MFALGAAIEIGVEVAVTVRGVSLQDPWVRHWGTCVRPLSVRFR